MADDPYDVLGVSRGASDDDIRRAYLKLVKELHPDVNPAKSAEERFKKVTSAHDILGDPERRRQFDRGEIDASGVPPAGHGLQVARARAGAAPARAGGADVEEFGDVFSDFFSGGFQGGGGARNFSARGRDVRYTLDVEFTEAVQGAKKRVSLPDGGTLDLSVPEGVSDGQVLRLQRTRRARQWVKARPETRWSRCAFALTSDFERQGNDKFCVEVPITIDEAVLGARVEVPTVSGRVHLTTSEGHELRPGAAPEGQGCAQRTGWHGGRSARRRCAS